MPKPHYDMLYAIEQYEKFGKWVNKNKLIEYAKDSVAYFKIQLTRALIIYPTDEAYHRVIEIDLNRAKRALEKLKGVNNESSR